MSEQPPQQMTTADAARDLRIMAASIIVDHDNYKGRLLAIADWIEGQTTPIADRLLYTSLQAGHATMRVQQLYAAGKYDLATYNELYAVTSEVHRLTRLLHQEAETGRVSPYFFGDEESGVSDHD